MTEENRQGDQSHHQQALLIMRRKMYRQKHRQPAFCRIAQQGQRRCRLLAAAQHIGRAGIAGTIGARIGEAERLAHQHRERNRADQVGAHNKD